MQAWKSLGLVPLTFGSLLLFAGTSGCELLVAPDRSLIPEGGGGQGGSAGGGGTGGAECTSAADCETPTSECLAAACDDGACTTTPKPPGTPVARQTAGDCKVSQCDGAGNVVDADDDTDVPDDGQECTEDVCNAGVPANPPKAADTPCGTDGALSCDGAGKCVGCVAPEDCGPDSECQHPACMGGVCGTQNEPRGTPLAAQTAGDCQVAQCDGAGGTETADDNADLPDDDTECTQDLCVDGAPMHPPVAEATACTERGGSLCDAMGDCVECLVATDCPGADDECKTRTCDAGVCGVDFTARGTPVTSQTPGDCKQNVCDGAGNVLPETDDSDVPNDNNPCTSDICTAGAPGNPFEPLGTECGADLVCNAAGGCQGCNSPDDCPGDDDECKTRTCDAGTCGFDFAESGTPVAAQVDGDCKVSVCDGTGNVVSQDDDSDLPADDGSDCTVETCTAGVPSAPAQPINTPCATGGGGVCSAAGACVECNAPAQCPGTDTDCQTRTCLASTCGLSFATSGTPTGSQTPGDCKEVQCDGLGGTTVVDLSTDLPLEDGNECTEEVCVTGTPDHPPKPVDTPCTDGGGSFCNASGTCVQCTQDSQCASMVCDEAAGTCSAPSCTDMVENGDETDVDCGGTCATKCAGGEGCAVHADCEGGGCDPMTLVCAPTCNDGLAPPDSDCVSYCACMDATCSGEFASVADCIDACAAFTLEQMCCRAYHCSAAAMASPEVHCPHAAGEAVCP